MNKLWVKVDEVNSVYQKLTKSESDLKQQRILFLERENEELKKIKI